ncbi:hypothetical protein TNCV_2068751 [Trichonephila clavipes]|uniref:Uncharacterized protein n=1 Tax=Trichonephila clavipes TaxID=2585209 RepID=A0A8X6W3E2_TRICX|nr:hypothetical protein TNCV_2068751 [Trichonephila clavipes]
MNLTWRNPPAHHWYAAKSPGLSLQCKRFRVLKTVLARFRSGAFISPGQLFGDQDPACDILMWKGQMDLV